MKLTKEKCKLSLNWFKGATCMGCSNNYPNCYSKCIEKYYNTLDQLINEHFKLESNFESAKKLYDSLLSDYVSLTNTCQALTSQVDTNVYEKAIFRIDYIAKLLNISTTSVQELKSKLKIEKYIYYNDFLRIKKLAEEIKSKYKKVALSTINEFIEVYGIENF